MAKKKSSIKKRAKKPAAPDLKTPAKKKAGAARNAGGSATAAPDQLLTGWPAIAKYLGQPLTVAQRWARDGMPVERKGRSMTANPEDLATWLGKEAGTKAPVHIAQASDEDFLADLRRGLKEVRATKRK